MKNSEKYYVQEKIKTTSSILLKIFKTIIFNVNDIVVYKYFILYFTVVDIWVFLFFFFAIINIKS